MPTLSFIDYLRRIMTGIAEQGKIERANIYDPNIEVPEPKALWQLSSEKHNLAKMLLEIDSIITNSKDDATAINEIRSKLDKKMSTNTIGWISRFEDESIEAFNKHYMGK